MNAGPHMHLGSHREEEDIDSADHTLEILSLLIFITDLGDIDSIIMSML